MLLGTHLIVLTPESSTLRPLYNALPPERERGAFLLTYMAVVRIRLPHKLIVGLIGSDRFSVALPVADNGA